MFVLSPYNPPPNCDNVIPFRNQKFENVKIKFEERSKVSEGLVQCELYSRLKEEGIFSYPEFKHEVRGRICKFDLAIFDKNDYLTIIIECKSRKNVTKECIEELKFTKQYIKYKKAGVPILYCINLDGIEETVKQVKILLSNDKG